MRPLLGIIAYACLIIQTQSTSENTIPWLSDMNYYSFQTTFFLLDYNKDGAVTINEAKLGILSILDGEYLSDQPLDENGEFSDEVYAQYHTYQPSKYNCVPSMISVTTITYILAQCIQYDNNVNIQDGFCRLSHHVCSTQYNNKRRCND